MMPAIRSELYGLLSTGVLLLHDSGMPLPMWQLRRSGMLISSGSIIFGPLKEALGGKTFQFDEEVQEWLCMQSKDFFTRNPGVSEAPEDPHLTQRGLC
jgi:hypothetical protein